MKKKRKTYKELERELIDLKIDKHKKRYLHIPLINLYPLIGVIFFSALAYFNLKLLDWGLIEVIFSPDEIIEQYSFHYSQLINIYPIVGEYLFIALAIISLVALFKGGYNKLKKYDEEGLILGLMLGLIIGLIIGLICGLIIGLMFGLIVGLIGGLICGLIGGLIFGLIFGLILGLIEEFK